MISVDFEEVVAEITADLGDATLDINVAVSEDAAQTPTNMGEITPISSPDKHYTHNQNTASDVWIINHGLGKNPSVTVVDSAGTEVVGDIEHIDTNTVKIIFSAAFSGKAYFN